MALVLLLATGCNPPDGLVERVDRVENAAIQFNAIQFNAIQFNAIQFNAIQFNAIQFNGFTYMSGGPFGLQLNGIGSAGDASAGAGLADLGLDGLYLNVRGQNGVAMDGQGVSDAGITGIGTSGIVVNGVVLGDTGPGTVGQASGAEDNSGLGGYSINGLLVHASESDTIVFAQAALTGGGLVTDGLDGLVVNGASSRGVKILGDDGGALSPIDLDSERETIFLDMFYHLVACALPAGDAVSVTTAEGHMRSFDGLRGLAPEWKSGALLPGNEAAVRACLETSPVATTGVALGPEQAARIDKLFEYMVQCAVPGGEQVTIHDGQGNSRAYDGAMGLAAEWRSGPLSETGKRRVSACLAARANVLEQPVQISLRGAGIATSQVEREIYRTYEGGFWANLFADEPYVKSCLAEGGGLSGRVCAEGKDCGFEFTGDCDGVCGARDPVDGHFIACEGDSAVISTYLSLGHRMRASDSDNGCLIEGDNTAWCWGNNIGGQVGDGTSDDRPNPTFVEGLGDGVLEVSLGSRHTCARKSEGSVWCWGRNSEGQVGDGTTQRRKQPVQVTALGFDAIAVHTGFKHSCAAKSDGTVACWGDNPRGQLGDGTTVMQREVPTAVVGVNGVARLSTGLRTEHTCAITGDGDVLCWGANDRGQLGDGATVDRAVAVPVDRDEDDNDFTLVTEICGGPSYTCARKVDGSVWCWGKGQLRPRDFSFGVAVAPDGLSCGKTHVCAVGEDSSLWCMGKNDQDQLGYDTGGATTESFGRIPGLHAVNYVTAGTGYTCATRPDGTLGCVGSNDRGLFPVPLSLTPKKITWPMCGDGTCESGEDAVLCPLDC